MASYGFRSKDTWNMAAYVQQTLDWLPQLSSGKSFQYGSVAASPAVPSDFTLVQALKFGVSKLKQVTIFSSHAYQKDVCTPAHGELVKIEDYILQPSLPRVRNLGLNSPRIHRVAHLDTHDLAHYAIYSGNQLKKMVILNTQLYNSTTDTRPAKRVDLSSIFGKKLAVKRFTAPITIAKTGVTWGNQAVDGKTGKFVGKETWESVNNGVVDVFASEAVIIQKN
ncbi:hypothetical protein VE02_00685 [Pseudogymnoascus sp. 03VT05]|nr:hypothetical protein VE02_00685 [Pseudogymnoascus sp. 03VT05]